MPHGSLDHLFRPRAIAVAGVSADPGKFNGGRRYMESLLEFGFRGEIYPVNPGGGEIEGRKVYRSVRDIPGVLDYVISAVPASRSSQLVEDCAAKGVKTIHFFTAGFGEIEDEEGGRLESEVVELARRAGIRILGPNCMGLYCPDTGLSFSIDFPQQKGFPKQGGPAGLLAQSGGNSSLCVREGTARGLLFNKVVSYGNAVDLDEADFLEYFASDPEIRVVLAYIEGVKDGPRFLRVLGETARAKPVVVFKGGATESGRRAAASHTAAIAGSSDVWRVALRQAGAIQVHGVEEMVDVALALLRMPVPEGRNAAVVGVGGGASVQATDACARAGLSLPLLPTEVREKLTERYGTEAGSIFRNPVDLFPYLGPDQLLDDIKMVAACAEIDVLIMHLAFDVWAFTNKEAGIVFYVDALTKLKDVVDKPVAVALHSVATEDARRSAGRSQDRICEAGLPVYASVGRAARAVEKVIRYSQRRRDG